MQSFGEFFANNKLFGLVLMLVVLAVIAAVGLLLYRLLFGRRLSTSGGSRQRQPRLGVVDAFDLDRQRQLVIVRRDNVEHLLMIGGPNDLVIEAAIVRAAAPMSAGPVRDKEISAPQIGLPAPPVISPSPPVISPALSSGVQVPGPSPIPVVAPTIPASSHPETAPPTVQVPTGGAPPPDPNAAREPTVSTAAPPPPRNTALPGARPLAVPPARLQPPTAPGQTLPPRPTPSGAPLPPRTPMRPLTTPTRTAPPIATGLRTPTPRDPADTAKGPEPTVRAEPILPRPSEKPGPARPAPAPATENPALTSDAPASTPPGEPKPPELTPAENPVGTGDAPPPMPKPPAPPFPKLPPRASGTPVKSVETLESLEEEMAKLLGRPSTPPEKN